MTRPLLLDLFCGAGGAAMGYHRAGFDIIGIDINPQRDYPFRFIQSDALNRYVWPDRIDAIHASPPCQRYSSSTRTTGNPNTHPDLIAPTRDALDDTGTPYILENVPGAPLRADLMLCGSMFNLKVRRHRIFELGRWWTMQPQCNHRRQGRVVDVTGNAGGPNQTDRPGFPIKWHNEEHAREVMEMPWATGPGCTEAIPPAYTEYIGRQLLREIT